VDQDTWDRLQGVLSKPERRTRVPRRDARHYLLTGVLRCGVCGALMYGNKRRDRFDYRCAPRGGANGHVVAIDGGRTDLLVSELIFRKMLELDLDGTDIDMPAWPREAELAQVRQAIAETMEAVHAGQLSRARGFALVEKYEADERELSDERAAWLGRTTGPKVQPIERAVWEGMDDDEKRPYIEDFLNALYVKPASSRGRRGGYDPERLTAPDWRGDG